jgi:hypothetical protein
MIAEQPLTDGAIALLNLGAQIDVVEPEVRLGRATVETRAGLVELITLRGLIFGRIAGSASSPHFNGRGANDAGHGRSFRLGLWECQRDVWLRSSTTSFAVILDGSLPKRPVT